MKEYNHDSNNLDDACGFDSSRIIELITMLVKELACQGNRSRMIQYIEDMAKKYPEFQRLASYCTLHYIESLLGQFIKSNKKGKVKS